MIAMVALFCFGVLYLQAWTSLHQFTPVMILPLIVFFRLYLDLSRRLQKWLLPILATSTAVCIWLSLPQHFQINQATRYFGYSTDYRLGDYEDSYERVIQYGWSIYTLIPKDYRLQYPNQPWGADMHAVIYYAKREKPPGTDVNYVIQPAEYPPPPESNHVLAQDGFSVYVRSVEVWNRDRQQQIPQVVISSLYEPIYRHTYSFFREYVSRTQQKASKENET
jgi:hypothetical protein